MLGTKFCRGSLARGTKMDRKMEIEIKSFFLAAAVVVVIAFEKKVHREKICAWNPSANVFENLLRAFFRCSCAIE